MAFSVVEVAKGSVLSIIFVATLVANSFVGTILFINRKTLLKHATYRFLLNIIMSDLILALFTIPFEITRELKSEWIFGEAACKLVEYIEISVGGTVILFHAFVALDRYHSVVRHHLAKLRPRVVKYFIVVAWTMPAVVSSPQLYMFTVKTISGSHFGKICTPRALPISWLDKLYEAVDFTLLYAIPLVAICWSYYHVIRSVWGMRTTSPNGGEVEIPRERLAVWKNKKRVTKTAAVVVVAFLICWSPTFVLVAWRIVAGTDSIHRGETLYEVAMFAAFFSEALNPILYCAFDTNFTERFKQMITSRTASNTDDDRTVADTANRHQGSFTVAGSNLNWQLSLGLSGHVFFAQMTHWRKEQGNTLICVGFYPDDSQTKKGHTGPVRSHQGLCHSTSCNYYYLLSTSRSVFR